MANILRIVINGVVFAAILFTSAGRWYLPFFWAYIAVLLVSSAATARVVDPELVRERANPPPGGIDRALSRRIMPFFAAHLVLAGIDVGRIGWTGRISPVIQTVILIAMAGSMALMLWAVAVNRFYSSVVRIQSERSHHLVEAGPYRFIRHPGYLASSLMMIVSGPALGSYWSMLALAVPVALILRRTVIEDAYLHEHLPGYAAYAASVQRRLIPGVW